ncbi:DUF4099 domain-containing protein [Bacteroides caecigallinarum]|uniref:DUF4099 domain-containing protein n=1 Tax=Bacteroides caecigallinarum TaxID=1411144 RepID=UPI001F34FFE9|nr:DUF4099 domain-containing protein [Bacteroides caecigallinarum]MCF2550662.1 DUF3945 domain-containing protein [Bacteroides caecigallinarum]
MEQKKKNEKDVLVVRDEKTGEISVVAGLDSKGYPKTAPAKAEHSQDFLRFDRHGDMVDNFFRNFYRQCKEPTRFGFYRVAADMADAVLPVIKDLLKDPAANAEMLAAHKVDTSEYRKQAETMEQAQPKGTDTEKANNENTNEENNVQQKTEEMEELKQEQSVQPSQEGGTPTEQVQEPAQEQQQQKPEKQNLIADDQVDWEELRKCGIDKEKLSEKDLKALMNYGKTGLVTVKPTFGYESYELQARLSFKKAEDGTLKLTPHFIRNEPRLDIPHRGYTFTDEDKKALKRTGNLGKLINFANEKTGEIKPHYISIDRLTNEVVDVLAEKVRIPNKIGQTPLSKAEQDILRAGLALPKEVTLKNGRKFEAMLQVNADKRDVEFVPGQPRQQQAQRQGKSQDNPDAQGQKQENNGEGQRRNRSWTNEDGSIRPIGKWLDNIFTDQQKADYVAGKTVVLANAKDDQGQPCTKYLKFSFEKGRPLTYSQNPDLAQTVAPSNESRTQLAVNNEGKTNEATKHVKEPLQQGQTAPKDETQQKRQTRKSKGVKVS